MFGVWSRDGSIPTFRTRGRTQHINLFHVGPKDAPNQLWADLPGYGYAAVNRDAKARWRADADSQKLAEKNITRRRRPVP